MQKEGGEQHFFTILRGPLKTILIFLVKLDLALISMGLTSIFHGKKGVKKSYASEEGQKNNLDLVILVSGKKTNPFSWK